MRRDLWQRTDTYIPVLGHRGIRTKYPENTILSFKKAIELGVDLIEFDVNMTKDGQLVVIHDNTIDRTCLGHKGNVRDYTLEELKSFDFGVFKGEEFKGIQIPTLEEVLSLAKPYQNLLLNVEIKDYGHDNIDATIKMIREINLVDRVVIACFNAEVLRYVKNNYPEFRLQGFPERYMKDYFDGAYDIMFGMGIPISLNDTTDELIKEDVKLCEEKGILPWLFCADTEEDVKRCVDFKCANITGNDPEIAINYLKKVGLRK